VAVTCEGARFATDAWRPTTVLSQRGEAWLAKPAAPMQILAAGRCEASGSGPARMAGGPEPVVFYVSARAPRASLRARLRAVDSLWAGPLAGLVLGATLHLGL
jgi:hypothetical protein